MTEATAVVASVHGLGHEFGGRRVLHEVDLEFRAGEVHALLGANGAGKTTLVRCLLGLLSPSEGELRFDGEARRLRGPRDAEQLGLGMVHQHFTVVDALDVAENLCVGERGFWLSRASRRRRAAEAMDRTGIPLDPAARVADLSVGEKQRLEILKALARARRLLVLDEPTASLAPHEVDRLFEQLRALRDRGLGLVLITHKLREVAAVADRVSVLRAGRCVHSSRWADTDADEIEALLRSAPVEAAAAPTPAAAREEIALSLRGFASRGMPPIDLELRRGELVGVAGVDGNGQTELAEALVGLRPAVGQRRALGRLGFVSGDRGGTGLALGLSVAENVLLRRGALPGALWSRRALHERARESLRRFPIDAPRLDAPASSLSGGNQQKLVLARELAADPSVLIAQNPTRGLDLASTEAVHAELRRRVRAGCGVLLLSTDLDEVLALSDRVLVADRGRLIATDGRRAAVERAMVGR